MAVHKLTPVLMTGSLFLGLVLAIGHHLYYHYLDGRIIKSQNQQEWFLRVGTGIAFLARALLSAAVGFAYTQILWRTLRSKSVTIEGVNSLFGVLHNVWDFTAWELWTAAPALAAVAIIAWALPLIAVITPATVTVQVSDRPNITVVDAPIPLLDYNNMLNFAQFTGVGGVGYYAPSSYVSRVLLSVASLGSILTFPAPFPNSSYSVDFYGPSISCSTPRNATFAKLLAEAVKNETCCGNSAGYIGFVPSTNTVNSTEEGYALAGLRGAMNYSLISSQSTIDETANSINASRLFVVVPDMPASNTTISYIMANKSIECALYNSSYAVNFTFENGQQNITYKSKRLNGVRSSDAGLNRDKDDDRFNAAVAYIALMDSLGKLLLGNLGISHYGVMQPTQTQIMSSILMDAKEMQVLAGVNAATDRPEVPDSVIGNISMANALEQQNDTAASHGNITYLTTQIAFSYEPRNLFIAYGLGLLASLVIVIIGLLCIKSASASYATTFSTILRTTRNPDIDTIVPAAETSGAEPLSKQLGDTRLVLRRQERRLEGMDEDMATLFAVDSKPGEKDRQKDSPYDSSHQGDRGQQYSDASIELLSHVEHSATDARAGNGGSRMYSRGS
ncbi:hypothetical protein H9Q69_006083 [Fusarium xylarioides]|uniref:Uncharacterized protein n=1 Tax=Fusarium xylarioides TaxID=221167 RepID=A0A9P7IHJ3_9HYPO|nr:hypothetical protein H9Q70_005570 [Fusarium xylarioides]KAG5763459.1 hypothetical protein H9Q72_008449 [Fusarium xylarioides]KAG5794854.1 hypothetical protein H9Q69_006083 [Fusarium xylarioides]KAG5807385.1 hypothetical protein H9Q71_008043 [Fusarium xylarioides]KAG5822135.1 hypothetical protein H9Q74_007781 [Fusarium xylarioides]